MKNKDTTEKQLTKQLTELRQQVNELERSEKRFRNIFENANDCIICLDTFGRILDVNGKTVQVFGGSKKELLGKHFTKVGVFSPGDMPILAKNFAAILAGKREIHSLCVTNRKGRTIWLECSVSLTRDRHNLTGMMVICRDITERKLDEKALQESKEKYRAIFENTGTATVIVEENTTISLANQRFVDLSGFSREEIEGKKSWTEFVFKEDLEKMKNQHRLRRENRETALNSYYFRFVNRNRQLRDIFLTIDMIPETKKSVASLLDITELKKTEKKLKRTKANLKGLNLQLEAKVRKRTHELEEAQEKLLHSERLATIGQLAASMAHELLNPLAILQNSVYFLKLKNADGKVGKHLTTMKKEISRADKIISDLLQFSRKNEPILVPTSINQIIEEIVEKIIVPNEVEVVKNLKDIPTIMADDEQLQSIFINLISNGIQAMPDGGTLTIKTDRKDGSVEVKISDTGVGIPEENLEKIFEPLFTTKLKGIGLGLAITKRLIEMHDGTIRTESKQNTGSTFIIQLPLEKKK